jgi:hypothetical protein
MASDPFDDLLELENDYYQEGYGAGVADSQYAGMIEGKVFGIEKGYEKAIGLGTMHGRSLLWQSRFWRSQEEVQTGTIHQRSRSEKPRSSVSEKLDENVAVLPQLPGNTRLRKHVDGLQSVSDGSTVAKDNSDEAVTDFDDRIAKASAKAKVIANIVGESLHPSAATNAGIEDATGLQARR